MPPERRRGEKLFGVASILAAVAVVVAMLAGADLGSLALVLVSAAVAAWAIYLVAFRRPQRWTMRR
jgi:hypothetical protein